MNFFIYFYYLLALLTSQVLAFDPRYMLTRTSGYTPDNTELENPRRDWKDQSMDIRRAKAIKEDNSAVEIEDKIASLYAKKSLNRKQDSWWPSKVDYFDALNESPLSSSESQQLDGKKSPTFEELEDRNANIHNPLLNLDHYPIPSKRYTFEELENMNANQYNPYLN